MELVEHEAFATSLAGRDRRGQADRLGPGEGTRDRGRQSVQRLAGGGQRPRLDRRRRDREHRRPRRQTRGAGRGGCHGAGQDLARPRARSSPRSCCRGGRRVRAMPICASPRAPRWTLRSSAPAVNLTLDDKGVCSQARVSLGAVAERALLVPEAAAALIGTKVDDDGARSAWPLPRARPAGRSTTSAAPRNSASRSPACWRGAPPRLRCERARRKN